MTLETERLILRPWNEENYCNLAAILRICSVCLWKQRGKYQRITLTVFILYMESAEDILQAWGENEFAKKAEMVPATFVVKARLGEGTVDDVYQLQ